MDQFKQFDEIYFNLALAQREGIEEELGCLYPCTYTEYQVTYSSPSWDGAEYVNQK